MHSPARSRWAKLQPRQEGADRALGPRRQGHAHSATHRARATLADTKSHDTERENQRGHSQARGGTAIVAFITAGYPRREKFREHLTQIGNEADVVEIGVPFTDPMADGMTIQRSSREALRQGVSLRWLLDELAAMAAAAKRRSCS